MKRIIFKYSMIMLFVSFCTSLAYAQKKVKILSYNVLYGLKHDSVNIERYKSFVKSLDPDIVATQEMNGWTQKTLEKLGESYEHPYALQSKEEGFPVALTSKKPMVNFKKVVESMWHSFIYTKVDGVHIFVIHFSPFSYRKRLEEVEVILAHAREIPSTEPILIMGDFNSLDESDSANYDSAMLANMRKSEEKHSHIRNLNNGEIDYSVLNKLKEAGFNDSYRVLNNDFVGSVPSFKDGDGNIKKENTGAQRRIDFLWVNKVASTYLTKSEIIKNELTDIISDHYPVYVELSIP